MPEPATPDSFEDLQKLTTALEQEQSSPTLVDRLTREYDIPIADLLEGAVSSQEELQKGLRGKVVEYVGRKMGQQDGEWGGMREDPDEAPTRQEIRRAAGMEARLARRAKTDLQAAVFRAYGRGLLFGAAEAFARQHHRMHQLDQLSEAEALRGQQALESTEITLQQTRDQLQSLTAEGTLDDYALAASRRSQLLDTADELAAERLEDRVAERAQEAPGVNPQTLLARTREELRREASGQTGIRSQTLLRSAWQPARLSRITRRLQSTRDRPADTRSGTEQAAVPQTGV